MGNNDIPSFFTELGDTKRSVATDQLCRGLLHPHADLGVWAECPDLPRQLDFVPTLDLLFNAPFNGDAVMPGFLKLCCPRGPASKARRKSQFAPFA